MKILQEIKKAKEQNLPFVAFRNPNETLITLLVQQTDDLFVFDDFSLSGYVFAPFDNKKKAYLLKADRVFMDEMKATYALVSQNINEVEDDEVKKKHVSLVEEAIDTIQNSSLSKIVISRKETIVRENFDCIATFEKLLYQYPNAYGYVWFHPKVGLWIGATPETLLKVDAESFKTMSLAGTQPYKGDLNPNWGAKEIEEQQMVSDFIKKHLEKKVSDLTLSEVQTVKAGNLLHLKTDVTGKLKERKDVETLVGLLHPTPAVCGLPKEISKEYILANEGYDRSFYTGYLGALNLNNQTSLFVNLRCFSVVKNKIELFVGGGITAESNAVKEWLETVSKSKTVKKILV